MFENHYKSWENKTHKEVKSSLHGNMKVRPVVQPELLPSPAQARLRREHGSVPSYPSRVDPFRLVQVRKEVQMGNKMREKSLGASV